MFFFHQNLPERVTALGIHEGTRLALPCAMPTRTNGRQLCGARSGLGGRQRHWRLTLCVMFSQGERKTSYIYIYVIVLYTYLHKFCGNQRIENQKKRKTWNKKQNTTNLHVTRLRPIHRRLPNLAHSLCIFLGGSSDDSEKKRGPTKQIGFVTKSSTSHIFQNSSLGTV